ncbi:hypothetical protein LC609_37490 [Nostoc sp. XA013]|nr:hypothetical protein [Nostoc sp. XA013]
MATKQGKQVWVEKHLSYEIDMLRHTITAMHETGDQLQYNVQYESFSVHARNLYQFLTDHKDQRTLYAEDFLDDYKKPDTNAVKGFMNTLNEQVLHPHKNRKINAADKIQIDDAYEAYKWLETQMTTFLREASAFSYQAILFIQPCVRPSGFNAQHGWTGPSSGLSASSKPSFGNTKS